MTVNDAPGDGSPRLTVPSPLGSGRVAVVTGAASGIGLGLAERFAAEGMHVVMADVEEPALSKAAAELTGAGASVLSVATDVSVYPLAEVSVAASPAIRAAVSAAIDAFDVVTSLRYASSCAVFDGSMN